MIFSIFYRGLNAEFLKLRGTFMLWFILLLPAVIAGINFLLVWSDTNLHIADPWRWYILFNYRPYFHFFTFMQILFMCHVNYLEHRNNTWKNIRVLPIPYWATFLSKFIFAYAVIFLSTLCFYCFTMLTGNVLGSLRPELGFQYTSYWLEAFTPTLKFLVASAGIAAIMYWISYHVKSILIAVVVGLICYTSAFALHLFSSRAGYDGYQYATLHPFNFPGYAFLSFGTGNHSLNIEFVYYGFSMAVVILILHYFVSRHRNII
jgi:lantibiotic transport system permease protein